MTIEKPKKPKKLKSIEEERKTFVIFTLRRASLRWPPRNEAFKAARVERGLYRCGSCVGEFPRKEVELDHIQPIINISGFSTWDSYIERLLCAQDNFQVLCKSCHESKSLFEQNFKKELKKVNK